MQPIQADRELLTWLTDREDPLVAYHALTELLDYPEDDPDVLSCRNRFHEHAWVKNTLAAANQNGTWGKNLYEKYRGTSWVLLHMSELGVPGEFDEVAKGVEYLLATAHPVSELKGKRGKLFTNCPEGIYWEIPIACLTAHMATVLCRYGHHAQPITRAAFSTLQHLLVHGQGMNCMVMEYSLLPGCVMAVPKVLKAFLSIPKAGRTLRDEKMIRELTGILLKFHLFRYMARDYKEWKEWVRKSTPVERQEEKPKWLSQERHEPRQEKTGWRRFSFPHNYNSDLLEVLLLLGEAGCDLDPVIENGLQIVLSKRKKNGCWNLVGGLNGKMWADLEKKGQPSRWITFRALKVFKLFDLFRIT